MLSYYPHIDESIFHSFIFVSINIPIVHRERSTRMKNDVPEILKCLRFKVSELSPRLF